MYLPCAADNFGGPVTRKNLGGEMKASGGNAGLTVPVAAGAAR